MTKEKLKDSDQEKQLNLVNSEMETIEFTGGVEMESIVRFNHESHLLGLNAFEIFSAFDISHQITKTMSKSLKRAEKSD